MLPRLDLYFIEQNPAQYITTADTTCTVHDLDDLLVDHHVSVLWLNLTEAFRIKNIAQT